MKPFKAFAAVAFTFIAIAAGPAKSATIDVSLNVAAYTYGVWNTPGNPISVLPQSEGGDRIGFDHDDGTGHPTWDTSDIAFWTATTTFNGAAGSFLKITDLQADDRVVVLLNGVNIAAAGIFNSPAYVNGAFVFSPGGASSPLTFVENGTISAVNYVQANVIAGLNTLEIIVNNTFDGTQDCNGPGGAPLCGGGNPTNLYFAGSVDVASAVPEPSTWAMMMLGFAGIGFMAYRRKSNLTMMAA